MSQGSQRNSQGHGARSMSGPTDSLDFCISHNHWIVRDTTCPIFQEELDKEQREAYVHVERDPNTEYPRVGTDQQGYVYTGELERFIAAYLTANPEFLKDLFNRMLDERIAEENRKAYQKMFQNPIDPLDFHD